MEKNDIIELAEKLGLPYEVRQVGEVEYIYLHDKKKSGYLRLSNDDGTWYARHNGICGYVNNDERLGSLNMPFLFFLA